MNIKFRFFSRLDNDFSYILQRRDAVPSKFMTDAAAS